ncbi:hypothetical protein ACFS5J_12785 [Flavobacterium chuncheonense]|uniref:Uncharacterized protein n=1 Tax=Flavobacterium chuncheonense TaxID=2026653 RepID=A0ABW5YPB6_9FLAO
MRIAVISFDYWGYDEKITTELLNQGHEAIHVKLSDFTYRYKNKTEKIINFISKTFLGKNVKKIKAEEFILSTLKSSSKFDYILVINPERISKKTHLKIKKFSNKYIAYLYDSLKRHNAKNLLYGVFDKIYSFDKKDVKEYQLAFLPNYIHLPKNRNNTKSKRCVFSISSIDERLETYNTIAQKLSDLQISFKFLFFDKKLNANLHPEAIFTTEKLSQDDIMKEISDSDIILDIVRENQIGLSFRIFDALALGKKIITTNKDIKNYDFYIPQNILIIDKNNIVIDTHFFKTEYQQIPDTIYEKYTLRNWIKTIFNG